MHMCMYSCSWLFNTNTAKLFAGCLDIKGTHITAQFFLLLQYIYKYLGCLNIHGTHVITNNSTNNNVVFFFVSDLKIVYTNNC